LGGSICGFSLGKVDKFNEVGLSSKFPVYVKSAHFGKFTDFWAAVDPKTNKMVKQNIWIFGNILIQFIIQSFCTNEICKV